VAEGCGEEDEIWFEGSHSAILPANLDRLTSNMRIDWILFPCVLLVSGLSLAQQTAPAAAPFRLLFSEVIYGTMASEQRCALIFSDRRFHLERANRRRGQDVSRKVYEGELSASEWNTLSEILDDKEFRELAMPTAMSSPVVEDLHVIAISVWRDGKFQNLEYLNNRSRKPYDPTLRPLLQWWKNLGGRKMTQSQAPVDTHCALEGSDNTIFGR
jgi:hypothetical protein